MIKQIVTSAFAVMLLAAPVFADGLIPTDTIPGTSPPVVSSTQALKQAYFRLAESEAKAAARFASDVDAINQEDVKRLIGEPITGYEDITIEDGTYEMIDNMGITRQMADILCDSIK